MDNVINKLKTGDVIKLPEGMKIRTLAPDRLFIGNRLLSNNSGYHVVIIDEEYKQILSKVVNQINSTINDIKNKFTSVGLKEPESDDIGKIINECLNFDISKEFKFKISSESEWVVTNVKMDGGSTGRDPYPDGHHVFISRLNPDGTYDEKNRVADFYQSGCFTNQYDEEIPVIREMKRIESKVTFV